MTSEADWEAAVALAVSHFGGLDILVSNAGTGDLAAIEETSLADWARTIGVDQTGVFLGMKTAAAAQLVAHLPADTAHTSTSFTIFECAADGALSEPRNRDLASLTGRHLGR